MANNATINTSRRFIAATRFDFAATDPNGDGKTQRDASGQME